MAGDETRLWPCGVLCRSLKLLEAVKPTSAEWWRVNSTSQDCPEEAKGSPKWAAEEIQEGFLVEASFDLGGHEAGPGGRPGAVQVVTPHS